MTNRFPPALAELEGVRESLGYLRKRELLMQYPQFQHQVRPIGSGMVESANKLVVEARLMSRRIFHLPCRLHSTLLLSLLLFGLSLLRLPCLALVVRLLIIPGNALLLADRSLLQKWKGHPIGADIWR